jgi:hypothetical protein
MPSKSTAVLTPLSISCGNQGTYSVAFAVNGISNIVANNIKILKAKNEYPIQAAKSFECAITQVDQVVVVYLMNDRGEPLTGGEIPLFGEFAFLEPASSLQTAFEAQELKLHSLLHK